jgi:RimJ/RimL family protein N-acetyltransferase
MQPLSVFPKTIKTARLTLSIIEPTQQNAETIFDIIEQNREYLTAWQWHFVELISVDKVLQKLEQRYNQIQENKCVLFGIYKDNNLIGRIRFFNIHDNECEIGYWLIKSANGQGYMSEALAALESELFKFEFDKIILEIDKGNDKSEALAKHNGYKLEKVLPMASWAKCVGKCDSFVYAKKK